MTDTVKFGSTIMNLSMIFFKEQTHIISYSNVLAMNVHEVIHVENDAAVDIVTGDRDRFIFSKEKKKKTEKFKPNASNLRSHANVNENQKAPNKIRLIE